MKQILDVSCAIIQLDNKVLIAKRGKKMSMPGKWEFPGGKIEKGETAEDSLKREILEELGVSIDIVQALEAVIFHYPDFIIKLHPFISTIGQQQIILSEHESYEMVEPSRLNKFKLLGADAEVVKLLFSEKNLPKAKD